MRDPSPVKNSVSLLRRFAARPGDDGYVLPLVIVLGVIMMIVVSTTIVSVIGGMKKAYTDVEWNAALAAAYAGVEDYKSRIEFDTTYSKFGNPASDFTPDSAVLPTGALANPAFNVSAGEAWATVPGSSGNAQFRYEVDASARKTQGLVRVRATGKVGEATRTVLVELRLEGFSDYIYWSDKEVMDPSTGYGSAACDKYYTAGRPTDCNIQFGSQDTLGGDLYTNDTLYVACGAEFLGQVYSGSTGVTYYTNNNSTTGRGTGTCGPATFPGSADSRPKQVGKTTLPTLVSDLKSEINRSLTDNPGCLYTGPTVVILHSNGTMTVWSPWTRHTQLTNTGWYDEPDCGIPGTGSGQLGSAGGATIPIPNDNVIYVQPVQAAGDPNAAPTSNTPGWARVNVGSSWSPRYEYFPANFSCINTSKKGDWRITGSPWVFPTTNEATPQDESSSGNPAYPCRGGDLYIKSDASGGSKRLTAYVEDNIYVIGDIIYPTTSSADYSILGLVANGSIFVWNPRRSNNTSAIGNTQNSTREIDAVLASTQHTFQVQNYSTAGCGGTLEVNGSIIQRYRGAVGQAGSGCTMGPGATMSAGYAKKYNWNALLAHTSPPKFIEPTQIKFAISQTRGVSVAFNADGSSTS